jgi:hypothetical protein
VCTTYGVRRRTGSVKKGRRFEGEAEFGENEAEGVSRQRAAREVRSVDIKPKLNWFQKVASPRRGSAEFPLEEQYELRSLIESYEQLAADRPRSAEKYPGSQQEIHRLRTRLKDHPELLWWSDLSLAATAPIDILDGSEVRERLRSWRRRLREVLGEARFALYQATAPDIDAKGETGELRADLIECIHAVHHFYSVYGLAARGRSAVTTYTFRFALLIVVIEAAIAAVLAPPWWPAWYHDSLTLVEYLLASSVIAVLGSVVSVQRRLQDPTVDVFDPVYRYIQITADRLSVAVVSPLFGAIFGPVAYALLASGLVTQGAIVPKFNTAILVPDGFPAAALILLYAFIAGFFEQFVPDALNRFAARALPFGPPAPVPVTPARQPKKNGGPPNNPEPQ